LQDVLSTSFFAIPYYIITTLHRHSHTVYCSAVRPSTPPGSNIETFVIM